MCGVDQWVWWDITNVIRLLISWLWVNQKGGCPGWAWPNQVLCWKESKASQGCAPAGFDHDVNWHVVREGATRQEPELSLWAWEWAPTGSWQENCNLSSIAPRKLILPTASDFEEDLVTDKIIARWQLDFSLVSLSREPSQLGPRLLTQGNWDNKFESF